MDLADIVTAFSPVSCGSSQSGLSHTPVIKAKDGFALIPSHASADLDYVLIKGASHELKVAEYKGFFRIKAERYNVSCILLGEFDDVLNGKILLEQKLFVVCQHDDERNVEYILKPPGRLISPRLKDEGETPYFVNSKGIEWPMCMLSLLGPLPV